MAVTICSNIFKYFSENHISSWITGISIVIQNQYFQPFLGFYSGNSNILLNQVVFKFWRIQTLWRMLKPWLCLMLLCWFSLVLGSLYVVIHPLIKSKALAFSIFVKVKCFQTKLKQPIVLLKQPIVCT